MSKKLISMFLALCFVLTLLPVTAAAADLTTLYKHRPLLFSAHLFYCTGLGTRKW